MAVARRLSLALFLGLTAAVFVCSCSGQIGPEPVPPTSISGELYTVEPPNSGRVGTIDVVPYSEVVL